MEQGKLNNLLTYYYKLIIFTLVCGVLVSCQGAFFKEDLSKILNLQKIEIEDIQEFNEWGGMQGEGYILEVYKLSENTIQDFLNNSSKNLPENKEEGKNWQKYDWSKTPFDSSYNEILIMCINYSSGNKKLDIELNNIKKVLDKEDVYHSFYYRPDKDNPINAQLFILDIESRKLYTIDQQI